jgi:DNA-binding transcriptional regulator LsrR (DeoR family)
LAEDGDISNSNNGKRRRRNHIPRRELAKKEIHRLILEEGLTNSQLCERLQIPRRTIERYLHEIFNEDNDILIRPTAEQVAMQVNMFREHLLVQRQHLLKEIAYNPAVQDANAKIAAHDLAADMIWAVTKLAINTPAFVIRHTKFMMEQENNNIKNNPVFRAIVEQKDLMRNLPSPLNPFE